MRATACLMLASCSDSTPTPDAAMVPVGPDRLNLNCSGAGGVPRSLTDCVRDLGGMFANARVWVGPRSSCVPSPWATGCAPLCENTVISADNCTFGEGRGCPVDLREGYAVVVDLGTKRGVAAVGMSSGCGTQPGVTGTAQWARVSLEDLVTAATDARRAPADAGVGTDSGARVDATADTGLPPTTDRFGPCETASMACGSSGDSCIQLMSGARMCTRSCADDGECGAAGTCRSFCYRRCADETACPMGYTCQRMGTVGACIPPA